MSDRTKIETVVINGIEHLIQYDNRPAPMGRGLKTYMFCSDFSADIPPLYWYRFFAGYVTTHIALIGMCMMECGDMLVGILETRCPKPRFDAVIYYAQTRECHINKDKKWKQNMVLRPHAPLTVDIADVKR